jgi:hypothetical protein
VCLDEKSQQLVADTRSVQPAKPGYPEHYDQEYQRNKTGNLFIFFAPQRAWKHLEVRLRVAQGVTSLTR